MSGRAHDLPPSAEGILARRTWPKTDKLPRTARTPRTEAILEGALALRATSFALFVMFVKFVVEIERSPDCPVGGGVNLRAPNLIVDPAENPERIVVGGVAARPVEISRRAVELEIGGVLGAHPQVESSAERRSAVSIGGGVKLKGQARAVGAKGAVAGVEQIVAAAPGVEQLHRRAHLVPPVVGGVQPRLLKVVARVARQTQRPRRIQSLALVGIEPVEGEHVTVGGDILVGRIGPDIGIVIGRSGG